jgi:8-oxo-dGTP diphosphatase
MTRERRKSQSPAQRTSSLSVALETPLVSVPDTREFPAHPRVGVGGIVVQNGHVLLVRRGREPLKGRWSIPGGLLEVGEKLQKAVQREIKEETGIDVEPLKMVGVFERIERDPKPAVGRRDRRVRYHYIVVDYICRVRGSRTSDSKPPTLHPASDVTKAEWVRRDMLGLYELSDQAEEVILKAMELAGPDCQGEPGTCR